MFLQSTDEGSDAQLGSLELAPPAKPVSTVPLPFAPIVSVSADPFGVADTPFDGGPSPLSFEAVTVNVYVVPFVSPSRRS